MPNKDVIFKARPAPTSYLYELYDEMFKNRLKFVYNSDDANSHSYFGRDLLIYQKTIPDSKPTKYDHSDNNGNTVWNELGSLGVLTKYNNKFEKTLCIRSIYGEEVNAYANDNPYVFVGLDLLAACPPLSLDWKQTSTDAGFNSGNKASISLRTCSDGKCRFVTNASITAPHLELQHYGKAVGNIFVRTDFDGHLEGEYKELVLDVAVSENEHSQLCIKYFKDATIKQRITSTAVLTEMKASTITESSDDFQIAYKKYVDDTHTLKWSGVKVGEKNMVDAGYIKKPDSTTGTYTIQIDGDIIVKAQNVIINGYSLGDFGTDAILRLPVKKGDTVNVIPISIIPYHNQFSK